MSGESQIDPISNIVRWYLKPENAPKLERLWDAYRSGGKKKLWCTLRDKDTDNTDVSVYEKYLAIYRIAYNESMVHYYNHTPESPEIEIPKGYVDRAWNWVSESTVSTRDKNGVVYDTLSKFTINDAVDVNMEDLGLDPFNISRQLNKTANVNTKKKILEDTYSDFNFQEVGLVQSYMAHKLGCANTHEDECRFDFEYKFAASQKNFEDIEVYQTVYKSSTVSMFALFNHANIRHLFANAVANDCDIYTLFKKYAELFEDDMPIVIEINSLYNKLVEKISDNNGKGNTNTAKALSSRLVNLHEKYQIPLTLLIAIIKYVSATRIYFLASSTKSTLSIQLNRPNIISYEDTFAIYDILAACVSDYVKRDNSAYDKYLIEYHDNNTITLRSVFYNRVEKTIPVGDYIALDPEYSVDKMLCLGDSLYIINIKNTPITKHTGKNNGTSDDIYIRKCNVIRQIFTNPTQDFEFSFTYSGVLEDRNIGIFDKIVNRERFMMCDHSKSHTTSWRHGYYNNKMEFQHVLSDEDSDPFDIKHVNGIEIKQNANLNFKYSTCEPEGVQRISNGITSITSSVILPIKKYDNCAMFKNSTVKSSEMYTIVRCGYTDGEYRVQFISARLAELKLSGVFNNARYVDGFIFTNCENIRVLQIIPRYEWSDPLCTCRRLTKIAMVFSNRCIVVYDVVAGTHRIVEYGADRFVSVDVDWNLFNPNHILTKEEQDIENGYELIESTEGMENVVRYIYNDVNPKLIRSELDVEKSLYDVDNAYIISPHDKNKSTSASFKVNLKNNVNKHALANVGLSYTIKAEVISKVLVVPNHPERGYMVIRRKVDDDDIRFDRYPTPSCVYIANFKKYFLTEQNAHAYKPNDPLFIPHSSTVVFTIHYTSDKDNVDVPVEFDPIDGDYWTGDITYFTKNNCEYTSFKRRNLPLPISAVTASDKYNAHWLMSNFKATFFPDCKRIPVFENVLKGEYFPFYVRLNPFGKDDFTDNSNIILSDDIGTKVLDLI